MKRASVVLLAAACGGSPPRGPVLPAVDTVRDLGVVANPSLSGVTRDGGAGGRVGGKVLWTFGDTRFSGAGGGSVVRASSGAYAEMAAPTVLSETLDAGGAPSQLIPFTEEERAYNDASGSEDDRYAVWPTAVLPKGENALILYRRVKISGGTPADLSTGFAEILPFESVAERSPEVFVAPDPQVHDAAVLDAGILNLFACGDDGMCRVARAPYEQATERSAYTFFTGSGWSADPAQALAAVPGSTSGFSVTYNTYLERFVSIASAPGSGSIALRVAEHPEGPYGAPIPVFDVGAPIHATSQHYELFAEAGRRIYVSYSTAAGEVHLLEIDLR